MIVRLWGGLGNQLFGYAFGRSVSIARNESVYFEKYDIGPQCVRAYGLRPFLCEPLLAAQPYGKEWREKQFYFDPDVYSAPEGAYFIGHWQTSKYFNEEVIRRELTLREPLSPESQRVAEKIRSGPSCAIHVRRGDYLHPATQAFHGCMDENWYKRAILEMTYRTGGEDCKYFVFSDDPQWCKTIYGDAATVVGHNGKGREHEDLALMAMCDHAIIPNSTFGWWGAWLSPKEDRRNWPISTHPKHPDVACADYPRIVIAPKQWFVSPQHDTRDIVPERWVKL